MIIWTVSDVITLVTIAVIVVGLVACGMFYLIGQVIEKLSKWRENRWEHRSHRN